MNEIDITEDNSTTVEDIEVLPEFSQTKLSNREKNEARKKVEDLLEEQALKKLLDDEYYYNFK